MGGVALFCLLRVEIERASGSFFLRIRGYGVRACHMKIGLAPRRLYATAAVLVLPLAALSAGACGDSTSVSSSNSSSSELRAGFPEVAEKDLAIAFSLNSSAPVRAKDTIPGGALFPESWYSAAKAAFRGTGVDGALETESLYDDWQIVSMRIAPCSALGSSPLANTDHLCWPELRIVWQPVVHDIVVHERRADSFADDRAFHALYDVPAELALNAADAARARSLFDRVKAFDATWRGGAFAPLAPAEVTEFDALRDRVVAELLQRVRGLRAPALPAVTFRGLGVRPESDDGTEAQSAFRTRVLGLLSGIARPNALKALTAFSAPEGREPATLDSWVFLSFKGNSGSLVQEDIRLISRVDGRSLVNVGKSVHATTGADDEAFRASTSPEVKDSIILAGSDIARLTPVIRDRRQRLVPNTGCASCHQLNDLRFDFHNFGYLEDRDLTIAPRVATDVQLDLAWLARP